MDNIKFQLNYTNADEQFIPTLDIKMEFGRNFSRDFPADAESVILNETAVRKIGWALDESVIGKMIEYPGSEIRFEVIGVMADFNYWSLESPIEPMGIFHLKNKNVYAGVKRFLALRIASQNSESWKTTLDSLNNLWKVHAPDIPFKYSFVDQSFNKLSKHRCSLAMC